MKWKTLGKSGPTLILLKDGVNLDCGRKVAFQRRKIAFKKGTEIKINVSQGWGISVSQSCRWEPGMLLVKILLVASRTRTELLVPLVACFVELVVMALPEFLTEEMASDSYPH